MQAILPVAKVAGNDNANVDTVFWTVLRTKRDGADRYPDEARHRRTAGRGRTPRRVSVRSSEMTNPPQQPGSWQDPSSWPPTEQQTQQQQPYPGPYGAAPVAPGYAVPPPGDPTGYAVPPGDPTGYAGYPGYPGYGYGPPGPAAPNTNGLAIASMVVSIVGAVGLCGYGLGGYIGIVGAILGHVARRQIRERGESGAGFALAGVIVGWIAAAIAILATIAIIILIVFVAQNPDAFPNTT
jgi:hypothetical protein